MTVHLYLLKIHDSSTTLFNSNLKSTLSSVLIGTKELLPYLPYLFTLFENCFYVSVFTVMPRTSISWTQDPDQEGKECLTSSDLSDSVYTIVTPWVVVCGGLVNINQRVIVGLQVRTTVPNILVQTRTI